MRVIRARNVHQALPEALQILLFEGVERESRNGPVLQHPEPVTTVYERPHERVMFHPWRDANPFFHFYESLWMLAGRNDVAPLTRYVKRMAEFSDNGSHFNAAYGERWRFNRGDQLTQIVKILRENKNDRRAVLQIWDSAEDLLREDFMDHYTVPYKGKDAACNLTATFQVRPTKDGDALDMVVFCRSNDIIWGCYGANAVHFSFLHEYIARSVRVNIGTYSQVSVNWHAYRDVFDKMESQKVRSLNPYVSGDVAAYPIMSTTQAEWDEDVGNFVTADGCAPKVRGEYNDPFFSEVALPIVEAHDAFKDGEAHHRYEEALLHLKDCKATDWRRACEEWIQRRYDKWKNEGNYGADGSGGW